MPDSAELAASRGEGLVLTQRGSPSAFLGLSVRNGLLNLITLTLYRFWGKTEVRRRLWATTYLNDEAFEYTGLGMELFKGFLLALAVIVVPFLIVIFGAQFMGPGFALLVILPVYGFMGFLLGFGRFTAFRYLASRTSWRGVRFQLRGSPVKFAWRSLGYIALSVVSLGWFWPAAERRLFGQLWDGLSFGDHPFEFRIEAARKEKVYGAYAIGWVGAFVAYMIYSSVVLAAVMPLVKAGGPSAMPTLGAMATIYATAFVLALVLVVVLAPFHAALLRSMAAGVGFGDVRFKLKLSWLDLAGMTLSNIVLATFSLGLLMPFVEARARKFLIDRLEATGLIDLDAIGQAAAHRPRTGEGLADAFGIAIV
jgi:uncharacterized membrane protein YjgN (DUF898 family)